MVVNAPNPSAHVVILELSRPAVLRERAFCATLVGSRAGSKVPDRRTVLTQRLDCVDFDGGGGWLHSADGTASGHSRAAWVEFAYDEAHWGEQASASIRPSEATPGLTHTSSFCLNGLRELPPGRSWLVCGCVGWSSSVRGWPDWRIGSGTAPLTGATDASKARNTPETVLAANPDYCASILKGAAWLEDFIDRHVGLDRQLTLRLAVS